MVETMTGRRAALSERLNRLVARRRLTKLQRLLSHPLTTIRDSAGMRSLNLISRFGKTFQKKTRTYFDESMTVIVPSGYGDVYLSGATVDADAEVRLNFFLVRELQEGGVFFDIGACLGYYSLLGANLVGPTGAVHTFEPSPVLITLLRSNLDGRPNVHVVNKAMSAAKGTASFYTSSLPYIGNSSLRGDWQSYKKQLVTVDTIGLDDYCFSAGVFPDIIKLDVEGVEDQVLMGAARLLKEKAPILVMEMFTPPIETDRKALGILRDHGYRPFAIEDDGRLKAVDYGESLDRHLAELKIRYRVIQDSPNDFDNLVFRPPSRP